MSKELRKLGQRNSKAAKDELFVAGVGSSAGGLEALSRLFAALPAEPLNLSIVVAQHLSPTHKSHMVELLARKSVWEVQEAMHNQELKPNTIYITPPDRNIIVQDGHLSLSKAGTEITPKPSVNLLFNSIAENYGPKGIGIILSGTGTDGTSGIKSISEGGGPILIQKPSTAAYDGMPQSAVGSGLGAEVLEIDEIARSLIKIVHNQYPKPAKSSELSEADHQLRSIYDLLQKKTGVDFSDYKISTIQRRLESRISHLKLNSLSRYLNFIEKNPAELNKLFNHVLIGVTHFFRDPEYFEALKSHLKELIKQKTDQTLRVWIPGCASGEEAYTISILISEILASEFNQWKIQIFATDIDENAIADARKGVFHESVLKLLDPELLNRYFTRNDHGYKEVNKKLRSLILFSRHDVTNNPPFLNIDLISCRNLLIYFNLDLQKRVIPIFHFALCDSGILFLGKSENISTYNERFLDLDKKHKIWARKPGSQSKPPKYKPLKPRSSKLQASNVAFEAKTIPQRVEQTLFTSFAHPLVVINDALEIQYISGDVSPFLQFNEGAMSTNILKQCRSEIELILHPTVQKAIKDFESQFSKTRRIETSEGIRLIRILVHPMLHFKVTQFLVIFESLSVDSKLLITNTEGKSSMESLRIAELQQELDSTREHLQSYIEELETANEEMQALNEELQSTNEELQSVNEELETSNEELQSTNEEMHIAYQELRDLHEQLKRHEEQQELKNDELEGLLNNDLQGFILIDEDFEIKQFNGVADQLLENLSSQSLKKGNSLLKILPEEWVSLMVKDVKSLKQKEGPIQRQLGHSIKQEEFLFNISINKLPGQSDTKKYSLGILDISETTAMQNSIKRLKNLLDEAGSVVNMGGWELDLSTGKSTWTRQVFEIHEVEEDYLTNLSRGLKFYPPEAQAQLNECFDDCIHEAQSFDLILPFTTAKGKQLMVRVTGNPFLHEGKVTRIWGIIQDVSEQYASEKKLKDLNDNLIRSNQELEEFAYVASHDLQEPLRMIYSFTQLLEESIRKNLSDKEQKYLHFITDGAHRMQLMLTDLLEYSRVNTNKDAFQITELKEPIAAAIRNLGKQIKESQAEIEVEELPSLKIIPSQIERLFNNLIINAIKYNHQKPKIKIAYKDLGAKHQISVKDNGIGIDSQYYERIFGIFQRLHSRNDYPGNGVGLSICKRILVKHHGSISVKSKLGQGSTFIIHLPK